MSFQKISRLVIRSDAPCTYAEAVEAVPLPNGDDVLLEDAGFVVDDESQAEIAGRSFKVRTTGGPGNEARGFKERVDVRVTYGPGAHVERSRCGTGGQRRFLLTFDHGACEVLVKVRIFLYPEEDVDLDEERRNAWNQAIEDRRDAWKRAIEDAWSGQVKLVRTSGEAPCEEYAVRVEVEWLDARATAGERDYSVQVRSGDRRVYMTRWNIDMPGLTAAHEFGHMLGNIDEYDGTCDLCPDRPVVNPSIMNDQEAWPWASPHHFWLVRRQLSFATCSEFEAVAAVEHWHAEGAGEGVDWDALGCSIGGFLGLPRQWWMD